jgi:hypothetical protein
MTVIPLYQKALLDEAIAKKELELKTATSAIENKYVALRTFSVKEFIFTAGFKCSGIDIEVGTFRESYEDQLYKIDVARCLTTLEAHPKALAELLPEDRITFRAALKVLGARLNVAKVDSTEKDRIARALPETYPYLLPATSEKVLKIQKELAGEKAMLRFKWDMGIDSERRRIANEYSKLVRDGISDLQRTKWTTAVSR